MNKLILDGVEYKLSDELVAKLKESVAAQDWLKNCVELHQREYGTGG